MRLALIFPLLALSACSLTPQLVKPELPVPAQYSNASAAADAQPVSAAWWQRFGSAELDLLVAEALAANHDLKAAVARIAQSRASAQAARASLLPSVNASASASTSRNLREDSGTENGSASVSVAYELDLWGGNAASAAAAAARFDASRYSRDAAELLVQSDVASNYFQILALKDRLAIARQNLEAATQLLKLVQLRFDLGAANALELAQQKTTLLGIEASTVALEQSLQLSEHALAILLARAPGGFTVQGRSLAELKLPAISPGSPASLLVQRPDLRAAEASLQAANADIGAARAALFPSVSLSASAGVQGLLTGSSSTLVSAAASLAQTLFDAGRRQSQVALSRAQEQALVAAYAQAVLVALKEVEDSLVTLASSQQRAALLQQSATQAETAYRLASLRYQAGADDLLTLLDSQRSRLSAQDSTVQAQLASYTAATALFKAVGGGF